MPLRTKGEPAAASERLPPAIERSTLVASANPWWDDVVVWFLAALELPPGVTTGVRLDERSMTPVAATMQAADGSWAEVELGPDDDGRRMIRGSSADLWAAVERAYALWHELGEPEWDSFGLTVTPNDQRVWFDSPHGQHVWPLVRAQL